MCACPLESGHRSGSDHVLGMCFNEDIQIIFLFLQLLSSSPRWCSPDPTRTYGKPRDEPDVKGRKMRQDKRRRACRSYGGHRGPPCECSRELIGASCIAWMFDIFSLVFISFSKCVNISCSIVYHHAIQFRFYHLGHCYSSSHPLCLTFLAYLYFIVSSNKQHVGR